MTTPRRATKPLVAKLSPSNADKWLACPGYGQAAAAAPPRPAQTLGPAEEGTAAHSLLEVAGRLGVPAAELLGMQLKDYEVDDSMAEAVQVLLDWLADWTHKRPDATIMHEHIVALPLGTYTLTGTSDIVGWSAAALDLLVVDYKHGANLVDAVDNPQLGLYMLGVQHYLETHAIKPKRITGVICQPRATHHGAAVRLWQPSLKELVHLKDRATEAIHAAHQPDAPRIAGEHCRWCPASATCRALADHCLENAMTVFTPISTQTAMPEPMNPANLNAAELAYAMGHVRMIEAWLRSVEAEGLRRLLKHESVPGFKIVAGRVHRKWASTAAVLEAVLKSHAVELDAAAPRSLLSPAALLKVAKAAKDAKLTARLEQLVTRGRPAAHIAAESDPRPALSGTAALDFKPLPEE